ncbi:hypothetical protein A9G34_08040 [Gilliamella sp. Choc4-2]|jgi:prepilin peptidase dependent protein B|nr:prepilin peptidase-dependent protein [Gilliamella apicola]KFA59624.1 Prepilin peptidase dependent protein B precursor [Gilliamella apicola]OCG33394.1 hypothetical protein A9G33_01090 [Gilliamella apicola]OCG43546.1 hypothetical protein A9G34_08040 [Gilliamella apicola]OCG53573.1 hypothetical protein A9G36_01965 [Gilliamella apicola]OCG63728.1 hypothetical protein A9G48_05155 [Gilliamella apicola]
MLKTSGFSLLEMLISVMLSSLIIIGSASFYSQLQINSQKYYQMMHLQQTINHALSGLSKDIKRAGFIANHPTSTKVKAIEINQQQNCIIIRYDSKSRHEWVYDSIHLNNSDIFTFRYYKNNLEYKTGAIDCQGTNWQRIFDPAEIRITKFLIKQQTHTIKIFLAAELKKHEQIKYEITKIIKNENSN